MIKIFIFLFLYLNSFCYSSDIIPLTGRLSDLPLILANKNNVFDLQKISFEDQVENYVSGDNNFLHCSLEQLDLVRDSIPNERNFKAILALNLDHECYVLARPNVENLNYFKNKKVRIVVRKNGYDFLFAKKY